MDILIIDHTAKLSTNNNINHDIIKEFNEQMKLIISTYNVKTNIGFNYK